MNYKTFHIELPGDIKKILNILHSHGYMAYVVGGCVRDSILNRPIHDWDLCTSATPEEMLEIFKEYTVIPTGLKHGTVTVMFNGIGYEITTFRKDGDYSDGRHPDSITFTSDIVTDLSRRDFTINAMAYNDKEGLIDPFNGYVDILSKKIRCVGNPIDRFNEDALRILRAIRFESQLENFHIDGNTNSAILTQKEGIKKLSMERVQDEFCKILKTNMFLEELLWYRQIFFILIPELKDTVKFRQNNPYHRYTVFWHTIEALSAYYLDCDETLHPQDSITNLAILFHDIGKPHCYQDDENGIRHFKGHGKVSAEMTDAIMRRLKFDNATREKVVELVYYHDATFEVGEKYVKRWLNKIGEEQFRRLIDVRKADIKGQSSFYQDTRIQKVENIEWILEKVLAEKDCFSMKDLAVNGNDLINIGYKQGEEIGRELNILLQLVIDSIVPNKKDILLDLAKQKITLDDEKQALLELTSKSIHEEIKNENSEYERD